MKKEHLKNCASHPDSKHYHQPCICPPDTMKISTKILPLINCGSKSMIRPEMFAVLLKGNKAVSTDGYRLTELTLDKPVEKDMLISISDLKLLKPAKKQDEIDVAIITEKLDPEDFPLYSQIIPEKADKPITFNVSLLISTLQTIEKINGKDTRIDLSFSTEHNYDPLRIDATNIVSVIMPIVK